MRRPYVIWSAEEWKFFALALHESNPKAGLLYSPALSMLTQSMVDKALKLMPTERQRKVKNDNKTRSMLLQIYTKAITDTDPLFFPNGVTFPATQTPAADTAPKKVRNHHTGPLRRVVWSKEEWVQIAAEIHRLNPHKNYPESGNLAGIKSGDIRWAQRVLPESRRRTALINVTQRQTLERLRPAFDTLREMNRLRAKEEARAMLQQTEPVAAAIPAPAAAPVADTAPAAAGQAVNPWEAAFKPMMGLLAGALLDQAAERLQAGTLQPVLLPLLTQALQQAFPSGLAAAPTVHAPQATAPAAAATPSVAASAAKPAVPPVVAPVVVPTPPMPSVRSDAVAAAASALAALEQGVTIPTPHLSVVPQHKLAPLPAPAAAPVERTYVMKVGIWGGEGVTWLDELRRTFPMIDIYYADNSKHINKLQRCDKVILMTNLVPQPARQLAKKHLKHLLVYINGTRAEVRALLETYAFQPKHKFKG